MSRDHVGAGRPGTVVQLHSVERSA
jgi:hypothetical protein